MDTNFNEEDLQVKYEPLSPWADLGYILLFSIPGINLVAILILAFSGENINRKNLARAYLINICFGLVLSIIISGIIIGIGGKIFNSANQLTEDTLSQIDSLSTQMFNSQFLRYEGSVTGIRVKELQRFVESNNQSDSSLAQISMVGETNIEPSNTYSVSFSYDSKTGYINQVTITEVK